MPASPDPREIDPAVLTATVTSLTHSFGDPTRRSIYFFLREHDGATASDIAAHCHVHPNVVRHHLERLGEAGYVRSELAPRSSVGRPAKLYRVTDQSVGTDPSHRRDALMVALLQGALERLGSEAAEALAHDVGLDYGRRLVATSEPTRSAKAAMEAVAGVLTAHGFDAKSESDETSSSVVSTNCPFGGAAQSHPVLCALERGLIGGVLEGLGAERTEVRLESRAQGDAICRATA